MFKDSWQKSKILDSKKHQDKIFECLNNQSYVKRINKQITLDNGREYTEFISCSYLGLDQDSRVLNAAAKSLDSAGFSFASARTRMRYAGFDELESLLNQIFNAHTVFFSSTHLAHLGLIPLLASGEMPGFPIKNAPHFILDKHTHSSIQINRGLMSQFGNVSMIDFSDVETLLHTVKEASAANNTPFLFCDSVGSMGNTAEIKTLMAIVEHHDGYLYLDDAHGMSIFGTHGNGYAMAMLNDQLDKRVILTTSLAKAFGAYGGLIVLKNPEATKFIKEFCSTYIFSGPPVTPLINASIASARIHLSDEIYQLQNLLSQNLALFDNSIRKDIPIINRNSKLAIRGWYICDEFEAIEKGIYLKNNGIMATVSAYPVVQKHESLIRFGICSNHSEKEIIKLCAMINQI